MRVHFRTKKRQQKIEDSNKKACHEGTAKEKQKKHGTYILLKGK